MKKIENDRKMLYLNVLSLFFLSFSIFFIIFVSIIKY